MTKWQLRQLPPAARERRPPLPGAPQEYQALKHRDRWDPIAASLGEEAVTTARLAPGGRRRARAARCVPSSCAAALRPQALPHLTHAPAPVACSHAGPRQRCRGNKVPLRFVLQARDLRPEQRVLLVGSLPELGEWQLQHARRATAAPLVGPRCRAQGEPRHGRGPRSLRNFPSVPSRLAPMEWQAHDMAGVRVDNHGKTPPQAPAPPAPAPPASVLGSLALLQPSQRVARAVSQPALC